MQAAALNQAKSLDSRNSQRMQQRSRAVRLVDSAAKKVPTVEEKIPQGVEYKNDFHWQGPRELFANDDNDMARAGLPTALELAASEAAMHGTKGRRCELRLGHGSLICMENSCQFLYRHSLLPEPVRSASSICTVS